ncbi:uncharacterized protein BYT42DRAFT_559497 [Radiomyces spectabilis]|uniref:uncharacterized protein n=1 Tax=Radiomyces spectabilis TaxID=64574 RepID=UPI00221EAF2E|nr:uncharacterized protein BYT42DRAFT_559497 [Radiomyces spectabilis]KAI8388261.1 hypothetical protein BYT42DRAFT_559497 [Radiomyces spectabilis]
MRRLPYILLLCCLLVFVVSAQESGQGAGEGGEAPPSTPQAGPAPPPEVAVPSSEPSATAAPSESAAAPPSSESPAVTPSNPPSPTASVDTPSPSPSTTPSQPEGCFSADAFSSTDYFADTKLSDPLQKTTRFNVTYSNTYKAVYNAALNEHYVLHCTQHPPNLTDYQSKTYIQIPVTNFAAVDTRILGFLDLLGHSHNIVYVGNVSNVTSPCVSPQPTYFNMSDSIDRSRYDLAVYPNSALNDPKGVGLGMNYDASPLALAEWIKYIALFTNQEKEAERIFNNIKSDYETMRDSINGASISYKRNVTVMSYDPMSTKFAVLTDLYFVNLTADAGGNLTTPLLAQPGDPSTMRTQLQNSSLVIDLTADYVFDNSFASWQNFIGYSSENITKGADRALQRFQTQRPYVNDPDAPPFERYGQLWRLDKIAHDGATDYWTRGMARPDLLIQDLIQAQYPDFFNGRERVFLRNLAANEPSQPADSGSYQCKLDSWKPLSHVNYANATADEPGLQRPSGISLGVIIGASVAGGVVALACAAAAVVVLRQKVKDRSSKRFTLLREDPLMADPAFDREPMMLEERDTGRLGGSGRVMA